jgi:hypothetical protein
MASARTEAETQPQARHLFAPPQRIPGTRAAWAHEWPQLRRTEATQVRDSSAGISHGSGVDPGWPVVPVQKLVEHQASSVAKLACKPVPPQAGRISQEVPSLVIELTRAADGDAPAAQGEHSAGAEPRLGV